MNKFKKGDEVIITAGKDKGRRGKIERVFPKEQKVLVAGINIYKRHLKSRGQQQPGGIIDFPRPLPVAKVALICPKCGQKTRVKFAIVENVKQRLCRKCEQIIS